MSTRREARRRLEPEPRYDAVYYEALAVIEAMEPRDTCDCWWCGVDQRASAARASKGLNPMQGIALGGMLGALIWGLLAVALIKAL